MADPDTEVVIPEDETAADEEMDEDTADEGTAPGGLEDIEPIMPSRTTFLECVPLCGPRTSRHLAEAVHTQLPSIAYCRAYCWFWG